MKIICLNNSNAFKGSIKNAIAEEKSNMVSDLKLGFEIDTINLNLFKINSISFGNYMDERIILDPNSKEIFHLHVENKDYLRYFITIFGKEYSIMIDDDVLFTDDGIDNKNWSGEYYMSDKKLLINMIENSNGIITNDLDFSFKILSGDLF